MTNFVLPSFSFAPWLGVVGILLGLVTLLSRGRPRRLAWFIAVLPVGSALILLLTAGIPGTPRFAPVEFVVWLIASAPAVAVSFVTARILVRRQAKEWVLFAGPLLACVVSAPVVLLAGLLASCLLAGDCL